jgi:hypothetical protein
MVIGFLLTGIVVGLVSAIGALVMGLPIWAAILLYPVGGALGGLAAAMFAILLEPVTRSKVRAEFVSRMN